MIVQIILFVKLGESTLIGFLFTIDLDFTTKYKISFFSVHDSTDYVLCILPHVEFA